MGSLWDLCAGFVLDPQWNKQWVYMVILWIPVKMNCFIYGNEMFIVSVPNHCSFDSIHLSMSLYSRRGWIRVHHCAETRVLSLSSCVGCLGGKRLDIFPHKQSLLAQVHMHVRFYTQTSRNMLVEHSSAAVSWTFFFTLRIYFLLPSWILMMRTWEHGIIAGRSSRLQIWQMVLLLGGCIQQGSN